MSRMVAIALCSFIVSMELFPARADAVDFTGRMVDLNGRLLSNQSVTIRARLADGTIVPIVVAGTAVRQQVFNNAAATFAFAVNNRVLVDIEFERGGQVTKRLEGVFVGPPATALQAIDVAVPDPRPVYYYYPMYVPARGCFRCR